MKFKYILIVLSVLQFGACSDDKGNYIYKEINELMVVENLEKGKLYTKVSFVASDLRPSWWQVGNACPYR